MNLSHKIMPISPSNPGGPGRLNRRMPALGISDAAHSFSIAATAYREKESLMVPATLALAIAIAAPVGANPVVRIAEVEIDPTALDRYRTLLSTEIEASLRLEPGVLALQAVSLKDQPGQIRILEIYADRDAYEAHLKAPHFLLYKDATAGMVRSLTLREATPILLGAKTSPTTRQPTN